MSQVFRRGRPSGCIILELLGAYPPQLSLFAHESELVASFCIIYMVGTLTATKVMSPCEPTRDRPMIKDWHGVCAQVSPCSVAKPKRLSSGSRASSYVRHLPWPLVLCSLMG